MENKAASLRLCIKNVFDKPAIKSETKIKTDACLPASDNVDPSQQGRVIQKDILAEFLHGIFKSHQHQPHFVSIDIKLSLTSTEAELSQYSCSTQQFPSSPLKVTFQLIVIRIFNFSITKVPVCTLQHVETVKLSRLFILARVSLYLHYLTVQRKNNYLYLKQGLIV